MEILRSTRFFLFHQSCDLKLEKLQEALLKGLTLMRYLTEENSSRSSLEKFYAQVKAGDFSQENYFFQTEVGTFNAEITQNSVTLKFILTQDTFYQYAPLLLDFSDLWQQQYGLYGYGRAEREYLHSNVKKIAKRTFESHFEQEKLAKYKNSQGEILVDCSQFPGCDLYYEDLLFTSCWLMYVSKEYEKVVPKEIFLEAQEVEKIQYFSDSPQKTIKTMLFKDPYKEEAPRNLHGALLYSEQLGICHLSLENGVGLLKEPRIEYFKTGDYLQCVQYRNDYFQPEVKSKATLFITRTVALSSGEKKVDVLRGYLNAKAFFPWMDERKSQMVAFQVLNPYKTLDFGLKALAYHIRRLLEVKVEDENFQDFERILMIYLPKDALDNLPIDLLKNEFSDTEIKRKRFSKEYSLQFEKNGQKLQVIFTTFDKLNLPHKEKILAQMI